MKTKPPTDSKCLLVVILSVVLASCAGIGDGQGDVAGSRKGKDKVVLYQRDSDSVSVAPHSHSLVLQHQW